MGTSSFRMDLQAIINMHSKENGSNTPDFILATYLDRCLEAFDEALQERERWYGRPIEGDPVTPAPTPAEGAYEK